MSKPVIILGAGSHAKVLLDVLRLRSVYVIGLTDSFLQKAGTEMAGSKVLGDDNIVFNYSPHEVKLVNGIGSIKSTELRKKVFDEFKRSGYVFSEIIHPSVVVAQDVCLAEGVQIMAGAVVQTGSIVEMNAIINTHASIDHDCRIGAHAHIAPGVTLSGGVQIGAGAHIGTGATIIEERRIGESALVAAGAVVVNDIPPHSKAIGVPARTFTK